jgi:NADPH-dependent glutamate synthase beta subunit-like oxidoreductase
MFAQDYNPDFKRQIENQWLVKSKKQYRFAIVGSGPAGCYMAKNLLKYAPNCHIDIYDRNPHPFGLIRTGVAPDHQAMKKIEKDFGGVLADEKCDFFGNVWVGAKEDAVKHGC